MSIQRQPAGSPDSTGGRFAPSILGESATHLTPADITPRFPNLAAGVDAGMTGKCRNCDRITGFWELDGHSGFVHLNADGSLAEVDKDGNPEDLSDGPTPDPEMYEGDTSYLDDLWSNTDWGQFYDSRSARNELELNERRALDSTGGIDLNQDPTTVRSQALTLLWKMQDLSLQAGMKAASVEIIAEHPDAAYLNLDESDQGSAWYATGIADKDDRAIAHFEEFEDEHWGTTSDLPSERGLRDYPWVVLSDDSLPKIDLRQAAQIDLHAIFEQKGQA
ncbi:hypothetical protein ACFQBY_21865 [Promicromonospora citrea]|uniref:Uncharacterized protein n=1 Tax=Promicromonospora citrea TaxID=43677 RepID=A0A8H9GJA7_9MICO|nr:hypothetical protein [Promicromonospora citrea]NNH54589.1 hypothetical protein [Promicromonospora citrea]GGM28991.1 hypothetical protein GCM10010102_25970 [Promicromonospora citrea]